MNKALHWKKFLPQVRIISSELTHFDHIHACIYILIHYRWATQGDSVPRHPTRSPNTIEGRLDLNNNEGKQKNYEFTLYIESRHNRNNPNLSGKNFQNQHLLIKHII